VLWSGAPDCLVCHRTVSGAPLDSVRCTRELNSELLTFGNSGSRSAIIHRTVWCSTGCLVCQWSNGYFAPTIVCREQLMRYSARRSQSRARRRTWQWTVTVRCTTRLSGGPPVRSSNGQNPTAGWRGWHTGQCPMAHRTVRCAMRQKPSPTVTLVVGAINTPNHPPFIVSKFSAFTPHTRAITFNTRHKQEIKSSPKSKDNSNQIVTSERVLEI
jgi:hypothetical protein